MWLNCPACDFLCEAGVANPWRYGWCTVGDLVFVCFEAEVLILMDDEANEIQSAALNIPSSACWFRHCVLVMSWFYTLCPNSIAPSAVWLENDALKNNPKIEIVPGDHSDEKKYEFKPAIPVKDRKSLLQYLDKQESEGLGNHTCPR